jgi:curved DNA-binding protein CbpA
MRNIFLYEALEVSPAASAAVIKAAYRALVQQHHPDRNPGDAGALSRMSLINRAYAVLGDPVLRAEYDQKLGINGSERRGGGSAPVPPRPVAGFVGDGLRPFAFRPLD